MSSTAVMTKISQLHNNSGMLAHALHTGIKPSVQHQLARVWENVMDLYTGKVKRQAWRSLIAPQEVFIDPEAVHAYVKLQSQLSAFVTATFLNQDQESSLVHIKHFIEFICSQYGIDTTQVIS